MHRILKEVDLLVLNGSSEIVAPSIQKHSSDDMFVAQTSGSLVECHGFLHNSLLIIPSSVFAIYLAFQAKKSLNKLARGHSNMMIAYYGCLWLVCLLNLAWSCLQMWECTPKMKMAWNILSLFTTSGMMFLEVSLVAFLLQGNSTSGLEALTRTFTIAGFVVGLDVLLKVIVMFGLGIPLFVDVKVERDGLKWGLWIIHTLSLTLVYGFILFVYHSKWRERLPARPAFYNYITIMFSVNALLFLACWLKGSGASLGFWMYETAVICYHAFFLPLLYLTFLSDFFQEEDMLHLDNVYYSEMKDAGFFEDDWE